MQKYSTNFSREEMDRLAQDPAVQQLLQTLSGADPQALQSAISLAQQGDMEGAKKAMSPLFSDPQLQAMLRRLGR